MSNKVFALIDGNNFFVSCERVFNPKIHKTPVVVLSNNDGCVVSRSNEAKAAGVKMAQPMFEIKELAARKNITALSANFPLYGDISNRIGKILRSFTPDVETYSIDESFLRFDRMHVDDFTKFGKEIRNTVLRYTKIPCCIGVASTKTLAKLANRYAKKHAETGGVLDFVGMSEAEVDEILEGIPVEDVWGVGRSNVKKLNGAGIYNTKQLKYADTRFIRKLLTISGERMVLELNGISCVELDVSELSKKHILSSRSFAKEITNKKDLVEAISAFATNSAGKLRKQNSMCNLVGVFIRGNRFKKDENYYSNYYVISSDYATDYTPDIIELALQGFEKIFVKDMKYKRAGVVLSGIVPKDHVQGALFSEYDSPVKKKKDKIIKAFDKINKRYHKELIRSGSYGFENNWRGRKEKMTQAFTTKWDEILTVS